MQVVWTVTLDADAPAHAAELEAKAEDVSAQLAEVVLGELLALVGDYASCDATVRIAP